MPMQQDEALEEQLFAALRDHNSSVLGTLLGTLILTDADINAPNESGQTALEAAFDWECSDEMRLMLIDAGADVGAVKDQIDWALRSGSASVLKEFVEAGADINAVGSDGTPLEVAVDQGDAGCALALLAAGASFERGNRPRPILGVAAYQGMKDVVEALLDAGAQPNCRFTLPDGHGVLDELSSVFDTMFGDPPDGQAQRRSEMPTLCYTDATSLIVAAGEGHADIVRLLVERGADVAATDGDGMTALDVAQQRSQTASVIALLDGGAHPAAKPTSERDLVRPAKKKSKRKPTSKKTARKTAKKTVRKKGKKKATVKKTRKKATRKKVAKKGAAKKQARKEAGKKTAVRRATRKKATKRKAVKKANRKKVAKKKTAKKRATR